MKIFRETAIQRLRAALAAMTPEGECTCRLVADRGIFCRGFARDTQTELRMRYAAEVDIEGTRKTLEQRANDYQVRRQEEENAATSCDVQQKYYETCLGWDEFTNEDLARFCLEVLNEKVQVVGNHRLPVV